MKDGEFRRLTGIKRSIFDSMVGVGILTAAKALKKKRGGRPNKLSIEEQLLMMLEYYREYRTFFHLGKSYGISESSAFTGVVWVEETLIGHSQFQLPGKKALMNKKSSMKLFVLMPLKARFNAPRKSKRNIILGKRKDIRLRHK